MSNRSRIEIVGLTDLHTGHPQVPAEWMYLHLVKYLYPRLEGIQLLVIGGDFFDRLCNLNSNSGLYAVIIVDELVQLALAHGFYIRVIRGTFSHDRYQNQLWVAKGKDHLLLEGKPVVRVLDQIEVEIFDNLGISVAYCPDDQPYADLNQAVIDAIAAHKLSKVDLLCSHGYWEHLLPAGLTQLPHNTLSYTRLAPYIQGMVINGHVHTANVRHKVFNCGSFERFQHGEEEAKGCFLLHYDLKQRQATYEFIENPEAAPFRTVDLKHADTPEAGLRQVKELLDQIKAQHPDPHAQVHLRLMGASEYLAPYIREAYPEVVVTKKSIADSTLDTEELRQRIDDLPIITEDNLPQMVAEALAGTDLPLTPEEVKEVLDAATHRP